MIYFLLAFVENLAADNGIRPLAVDQLQFDNVASKATYAVSLNVRDHYPTV